MTNARLLRAGHLARRPEPYYQALVCLGERLRQGSRGSLDLVVMPAGQAGDERAMPDRLAMGELDLAVVTAAGPGSRVPEVYAFDLPDLFPGRWAALAAADRLRSHLDRHFLQAGLTPGRSGRWQTGVDHPRRPGRVEQ
jgi:TRAP-type C4-dicarboxylate transport system substrate-binding protein